MGHQSHTTWVKALTQFLEGTVRFLLGNLLVLTTPRPPSGDQARGHFVPHDALFVESYFSVLIACSVARCSVSLVCGGPGRGDAVGPCNPQ